VSDVGAVHEKGKVGGKKIIKNAASLLSKGRSGMGKGMVRPGLGGAAEGKRKNLAREEIRLRGKPLQMQLQDKTVERRGNTNEQSGL